MNCFKGGNSSVYIFLTQARRKEIDIGAAEGVGSGGVYPLTSRFVSSLSIPRLDFQ